jgi:hypothetical protein
MLLSLSSTRPSLLPPAHPTAGSMLAHTSAMYTGIRPSLRAMTDSIFGDVWNGRKQPAVATPVQPAFPAIPNSPRTRTFADLTITSSTRQDVHPSPLHPLSPALARACRSFHSPPTSPVTTTFAQKLFPSVPAGSTQAIPVAAVEVVSKWPADRELEFVRATVRLSSPAPPRSRRHRPPPRLIDSKPGDRQASGLRPLSLASKARPCRHLDSSSPKPIPEDGQREPTSPPGLRPLLLASKARPARSIPERRRPRPSDHHSLTWPRLETSDHERTRRTITSVCTVQW